MGRLWRGWAPSRLSDRLQKGPAGAGRSSFRAHTWSFVLRQEGSRIEKAHLEKRMTQCSTALFHSHASDVLHVAYRTAACTRVLSHIISIRVVIRCVTTELSRHHHENPETRGDVRDRFKNAASVPTAIPREDQCTSPHRRVQYWTRELTNCAYSLRGPSEIHD